MREFITKLISSAYIFFDIWNTFIICLLQKLTRKKRSNLLISIDAKWLVFNLKSSQSQHRILTIHDVKDQLDVPPIDQHIIYKNDDLIRHALI